MWAMYVYPVDGNDDADALRRAEQRFLGASQIKDIAPAGSTPSLLTLEEWKKNVSDDQDDVLWRYWSKQREHYGRLMCDAYALSDGERLRAHGFAQLAADWQSERDGTLVYHRETDQLGFYIVFRSYTFGSDGHLKVDRVSAGLPPQSVLRHGPIVPMEVAGDSHVGEAMWVILKYVGAGLKLAGAPEGASVILELVMGLLDSFKQTADSEMSMLLAKIKEMLQQNRIQLEIDMANAAVLTWSQYEDAHFKESDLNLMKSETADKGSPEYIAAKERLMQFVTKVHDDLVTTPRLYDAVNLMDSDPGMNVSDLDHPTDGMLKISSYIFYSAFVLAHGKQAWLCSCALRGTTDKISQELTAEVTYRSALYAKHVAAVAVSVVRQIETRKNKWTIYDHTGSARFIIREGDERVWEYRPPAEWGYHGWTSFPYCGGPDWVNKENEAQAALAAIKQGYEDYFVGRFYVSTDKSKTNLQEFRELCGKYAENNEDFQTVKKYLGGNQG